MSKENAGTLRGRSALPTIETSHLKVLVAALSSERRTWVTRSRQRATASLSNPPGDVRCGRSRPVACGLVQLRPARPRATELPVPTGSDRVPTNPAADPCSGRDGYVGPAGRPRHGGPAVPSAITGARPREGGETTAPEGHRCAGVVRATSSPARAVSDHDVNKV